MGNVLKAALIVAGLLLVAGQPAFAAADPEAIARGGYIFRAAGCYACHTDAKHKGAPLAGGRALVTPFGTFYTPNITPDPDQGIGGWSDQDFIQALRQGIAPDGRHYYPAFPYPSYSGMTDRDILDLKAYLLAQEPVVQANQAHVLSFFFSFRQPIALWKALFFDPVPFQPDPGKSQAWNRGAYLVRHLGHCGECHTPRNILGAKNADRSLGGNPVGPDGKKVPNITAHQKSGIGAWRDSDVAYFLKTGFLPDGDVAGGAMTEVIEESTSHLTDADRAAIVMYLKTLPPLPAE